MNKQILPRVLPFALFMAFIGGEEIAVFLRKKKLIFFTDQALYLSYPVKVLCVSLVLFLLRRHFTEIRLRDIYRVRHTVISLLVGLAVFGLWINMDWGLDSQGSLKGFNPTSFEGHLTKSILVFFRLTGAALVVPIMEEIFWRSFLHRYIIDSNFTKVAIGQFSWAAFLISAVLFGLEHDLIAAGIMAGMAYNLLLYSTKSITQCIFSHAITNLALGIYVLKSGRWYFW